MLNVINVFQTQQVTSRDAARCARTWTHTKLPLQASRAHFKVCAFKGMSVLRQTHDGSQLAYDTVWLCGNASRARPREELRHREFVENITIS